MAEKKKTFEESLEELEELVEKMESGELPLDKSLESYERGVKLAAYCAKELDIAQKKIEKLEKDHLGAFATTPLDENEDVDEDGNVNPSTQ